MQQVHGNKVKVVKKTDRGGIIAEIDGMVTREQEIILGVGTADCMPIIFFEPSRQIIGIAHAGWRGVLLGVVNNVLKQMTKLEILLYI